MISKRRLLRSALATPALLTLPRLARAVCTPTGLGPLFTAPGSLPSLSTLPNPFVLNDGTSITTKVQWAQRRAEVKQLIRYYLLGHEPPPSPVNVVSSSDSVITASGGTMNWRQVSLTTGPGGGVPFTMNVYFPTSGAPRFPGPYPTLLASEKSWSPVAANGSTAQNSSIGVNNLQTLINRGYVVAEYGRDDFSDDLNANPNGVMNLYPYDGNGVTGYDWSYMTSQSWAYSRAIDYLFTLSFVDQAKLAVNGHSRGGECSGMCGAFDERVAVTISSQGGITYLYRYVDSGGTDGQANSFDDQHGNFPQWYNNRSTGFLGNRRVADGPNISFMSGPIDRLPFDWHQVVGLCAPRAYLAVDGLNSSTEGPMSTQMAFVAAQEIWKALGVTPSSKTSMFASNITSYIPSGHEMSYIYWKADVDFLDFVFFGIPLPPNVPPPTNPSHSYALPYSGLPQPWSWSTPTLT
jgi:hypothetical protein